MRRSPEELQSLVREYHNNLSGVSIPFWMEVPDFLDILDHFEQTQQTVEAEICLRIALRMHPDNAEILMRKVYRLKNDGRWHDAEALVNQIADQDNLDVQFFLAEKALSELRFFDANTIYENLIAREKENVAQEFGEQLEEQTSLDDLYLEIAELFLDYGSEVFAKKFLQLLDKTSPLYPRVQLLESEILMRYGTPFYGIEQVEQVIDEDPYNVDAWVLRAELANDIKDYPKCLEAAEYALAISPKHPKALRMKAIAALGLEKWNTVLKVYKTYHDIEPNDYTMSLSVGEIYLNRNKIPQARAALQHAMKNCASDNPDKQRISLDLAMSYAMEGDIRKAYVCVATLSSLGVPHDEMLLQAVRIAITYGFLPFAAELLRMRNLEVPIADERNVQLAQLLHESQLHSDFKTNWEELFQANFPAESEVQAYRAYAAVKLQNKNVFIDSFAAALQHQPSLLQQLFYTDYKNIPLHQISDLVVAEVFNRNKRT
jgi:hypothetical protein